MTDKDRIFAISVFLAWSGGLWYGHSYYIFFAVLTVSASIIFYLGVKSK